MNWATIIPVLLGSGIALATSISVEYMKYRQTSETAARERENAVRQQSREGLHALVTQVQDSLQEMILLAASMPDGALDEEQQAGRRARFRDVTIGTIRLVSQLPDEKWRKSVKEVISLTNSAVTSNENGASDESAERKWQQATAKYEEVMERVAEPIQKFYMLARS
jgi:hypothetical protein